MDEQVRIINGIKRYLKKKQVYEKIDDTLITELAFNVYLMDEARADIKERGIQVNIRANPDDEPYYQVNQSVSIYNGAVKLVAVLATKLGISVQERAKLGLEIKKDNKTSAIDEFKN